MAKRILNQTDLDNYYDIRCITGDSPSPEDSPSKTTYDIH
jgi:hypothetical protein